MEVMRARSRWRSFATGCLKGLLACVVFFGVLELVARYGFGFRPLTPGSFLFQHDARRGWSHKPNSEGLFVKLGFQTPIRINSRGLREREIPYEKAPGTIRVLVIGDSNVAGFEVAEDETFSRVTESVLRERGYAIEFVNAGHRGYGTDQSLLLLMDEGLKYHPDLVLYFWSDNDVDDNSTVHRPFRPYGKGYFDFDAQGALVLRGVPVPAFRYETGSRVGEDGELREVEVPPLLRASVMTRDAIISRSAFATFLVWAVAQLPSAERKVLDAGSFGDFRASGGVPPPDTESRTFRLTLALIREMERVAKESGARFQMIGVGGPWGETLRREAGIPELRDWRLYTERIPVGVDVRTPFDAHWNAIGNRLYAEQLADLLVQYELIPTRPLDVAGRGSAGEASVASP
jgi:hypothetical protein